MLVWTPGHYNMCQHCIQHHGSTGVHCLRLPVSEDVISRALHLDMLDVAYCGGACCCVACCAGACCNEAC